MSTGKAGQLKTWEGSLFKNELSFLNCAKVAIYTLVNGLFNSDCSGLGALIILYRVL